MCLPHQGGARRDPGSVCRIADREHPGPGRRSAADHGQSRSRAGRLPVCRTSRPVHPIAPACARSARVRDRSRRLPGGSSNDTQSAQGIGVSESGRSMPAPTMSAPSSSSATPTFTIFGSGATLADPRADRRRSPITSKENLNRMAELALERAVPADSSARRPLRRRPDGRLQGRDPLGDRTMPRPPRQPGQGNSFLHAQPLRCDPPYL